VVIDTNDLVFDYEWGYRVNFGRRYNECTAVEVSFLNLTSWNADAWVPTPDPNDPQLDPYWGSQVDQPTDSFDDSFAHHYTYNSNLRDVVELPLLHRPEHINHGRLPLSTSTRISSGTLRTTHRALASRFMTSAPATTCSDCSSASPGSGAVAATSASAPTARPAYSTITSTPTIISSTLPAAASTAMNASTTPKTHFPRLSISA
jgi:hypothetical protein